MHFHPSCDYMRWHRKNERRRALAGFLLGAIYGGASGFIAGVVFFNLVIR